MKSKYFWNIGTANKAVLNAQYAVRGKVPTRANQMALALKQNAKSYPFPQVTYLNIGNPQQFGQKPFTFNREVLSAVLNPDLIKTKVYRDDISKRAQTLLNEITSAGSYTHSLGIRSIRQTVSKHIARVNKVPQPSVQNIFLTEGASQAAHLVLNLMISSPNDAVLIPIPQYPLYTAALDLNGGNYTPYYLNQKTQWQVDFIDLQQQYQKALSQGKKVKAMVVINPGNPTGAIIEPQNLKAILEFATQRGIVIIADQVYQDNIYKKQYSTMRKVLNELQIKNQAQLISCHSISKGLTGQCGLRGGYMELHNIDPEIIKQLTKLKSIFLCANSVGQISVDLMLNNPSVDKNMGDKTKEIYNKERTDLFSSLKRRSQLIETAVKKMKNMTIQPIHGAMYAFPNVQFSQKAIQTAKKNNMEPDMMYCMELLQKTGIATVPGSGFKQMPGSYHFRLTTLILPQSRMENAMLQLDKFNTEFHQKY